MEIKSYRSVVDNSVTVVAKFEESMNESMAYAVLKLAAEKIAEAWVSENYQAVVANIKPEAVATLICAESAAAINKTLKENIPSKVLEVVKKEVYQRGLFGGITRIR